MTEIKTDGYVQRYPCDCTYEGGVCWIVRHPKAVPPPSYATREEAEEALHALQTE